MKKLFLLLTIILLGLTFISCNDTKDDEKKEEPQVEETVEYSLVAPSGTPSLGIAEYIYNHQETSRIVSGAQELQSAFINASSDIIVAPTNLGLKMYAKTGNYILFDVVTWGNLYLASKNEIGEFKDLASKKIIAFGQGSNPEIMLKAIASFYDITLDVEYVSDVAAANTLLVSGQADIIVSAEPSLSKLVNKLNLKTLDLQEEWNKMTDSAAFPQAGIFIKKELKDVESFKKVLNELETALENVVANPAEVAQKATTIDASFESIGAETLTSAIPNCHFERRNNLKKDIEAYINILTANGFESMVGTIPDEEFYY